MKEGFTLFRQVDGLPMRGELRHKKTQWDRYYKDIHAHLTEGAPLDVTPEQARRVIAIIEAAEKSAKSGQAEPVPYE